MKLAFGRIVCICVLGAVLWFGFVADVALLRNAAIVYVWALLLPVNAASLVFLIALPEQWRLAALKQPSNPLWFTTALLCSDVALFVGVLAYSCLVTAVALGLSVCITMLLRALVRELRSRAAVKA